MGKVSELAHHFLDAVDMAAIASARWRGKGDKIAADAAAVEAMRATFDNVPFDGRVAIGERKGMKRRCYTLANAGV